MAIATDSTAVGTIVTATSITWSHTCTGSNLALVVAVFGDLTSDLVTGATYNGVAMTKLGSTQVPADRFIYLFGLLNPATGANNVVVSASSSIRLDGVSASYTGVSAFETAVTSTAASPATSLTLTATTGVANCWLVANFKQDLGTSTAGTGTTIRVDSTHGMNIADSNGALTQASHSLIENLAGGENWGGIMAAMEPSGGAAAAVQQMLMLLGVGS